MRSLGAAAVLVLFLCFVLTNAFPEKHPKRKEENKLGKNLKQLMKNHRKRCVGMMMNKGQKRNEAVKRCMGYGYGFPAGYGGYGYPFNYPGCDMVPGDWFGWGYPGFGGGWGGHAGGWGGWPGGWGGFGGGFGGGCGCGGGCGGGCGCGCGGCCGGNCCGGFHCPHWCCCGKDEEGSGSEEGGEEGEEEGGEKPGEGGEEEGGAPGGGAPGEEGGGTAGTAQDKPITVQAPAQSKTAGQVSVQVQDSNPAPASPQPVAGQQTG